MAQQLRPGARKALDYLYNDLDDIENHAHDNPAAVRKLARLIRTRLRDEIEPMLQRAANDPTLEDRITIIVNQIVEQKLNERKGQL